jgi:hypothetical protein
MKNRIRPTVYCRFCHKKVAVTDKEKMRPHNVGFTGENCEGSGASVNDSDYKAADKQERLEAIRTRVHSLRPRPLNIGDDGDGAIFFLLDCIDEMQSALNDAEILKNRYFDAILDANGIIYNTGCWIPPNNQDLLYQFMLAVPTLIKVYNEAKENA